VGYEVGKDMNTTHVIKPSVDSPSITRQDTKSDYSWTVVNVPWPLDIWDITTSGNQVFLKTRNRKYFKILRITDMDRMGISLNQESIRYNVVNNTLVVYYKKPNFVLQKEEKERNQRKEMKPIKDQDCKQQ
jgi:hypothetical protein